MLQGDRELSQAVAGRLSFTMNTKMMAAGPWICSGNRTTPCGRVAKHFVLQPMSYLDRPEPFIKDLVPIPVCGSPECDTGAKQQLREFVKETSKLDGFGRDFMQREILHCEVCWKTATEQTKLRHCARCGITYYCSTECQRKDWKVGDHKNKCVPLHFVKK
jgi:hypothetical protein